jgi:2-oxoglutarate dehydrogenase E1 component
VGVLIIKLLLLKSLAVEGHPIRLSGQDCQRGTFSSRHGVIRNFDTGAALSLLGQLGKAPVEILNSPLSEQGVMGFDFGFSVANRNALVLWEGQFGDFVNGAQIIIDQFLVASEAKWKQTSGLVLLLPHGYEGMGPEHSSGRPERFLQLCGNLNIQVAIPTTAAQYFHILRRQMHRDFRKPLIIMTPKSLLRHPKVMSPLAELESAHFQEVLDDTRIKSAKDVTRIVFCSGKVFYELAEATAENQEVAVVRVEQLYPFPAKPIEAVLAKYKNASEIIWAQEEPQNMAAWTYIGPRIDSLLAQGVRTRYVGRPYSGTTAEGSAKAHAKEQARIVLEATGPQLKAAKGNGKVSQKA